MKRELLYSNFCILLLEIFSSPLPVVAPNPNELPHLDEEINSLHEKIWMSRKYSRFENEWKILNDQGNYRIRQYLDQCQINTNPIQQSPVDNQHPHSDEEWPTKTLQELKNELEDFEQQLSQLQHEYNQVGQDSKAFSAYGHFDSLRRHYWRERLTNLQSYIDCVEEKIAQNRRKFDNVRAEALALDCQLPRPSQLSS
ncbi:hypothetical protein QAD02_009533 [Eretmocerus hayati]|uniref:Uncharacterized protein n=1 Tax=Eretmocerus hayati TaxID=131215 RepID=A0ACC2N9M3_9HYME|nr:hypothetical protein QAD02_009533 [Eretmocerus hayati]